MKIKVNFAFIVLFMCCAAFITVSGTTLKEKQVIAKFINSDNVMDVTDFSVYYNVETNTTIKKMLPRPWYRPGWKLRFPFSGGSCNCDGLKCTCCTGIRIETFNFDRRTCTVLTFEPTESLINMEVIMSNNSVYKNTFSARNPPPFCVPIPVPYLPPGLVDMCIRLFDVSVVDQKLHVCMDMDTRLDKAPVLVLHFDCMDMGFNGIGLSKPGGSGNKPNTSPGVVSEVTTSTEPVQMDSDVFDPVVDDAPQSTTHNLFNNSIKYI